MGVACSYSSAPNMHQITCNPGLYKFVLTDFDKGKKLYLSVKSSSGEASIRDTVN